MRKMSTRTNPLRKLSNSEIEKSLAKGRLPEPEASKLVTKYWFVARHLFRDFLKPGWNPKKRVIAKQLFDSGYLGWPRKIQSLIQWRSVLDFGSGKGLHPLGYIAMGATHSVGFDPFVDPSNRLVKSKVTGQIITLGTNFGDLGDYFESVSYTDDLTVVRNRAPYECIVLHNVTEHLQDLPKVFDEVQRLLAPDGFLVFHHHNFYS
jgi:SAM-dependent methyltransferase